jgi:hypothetical protein
MTDGTSAYIPYMKQQRRCSNAKARIVRIGDGLSGVNAV